jgi:molybdate transport system substrate-binding protein
VRRRRSAPAAASLAALGLLAATAAGAQDPGSGARAARTVTVAVASNLKPAFEELARAFEASHPGVGVRTTYGASGHFFSQIRNGAPFDLFLSADAEFPAHVAEAGLADGPPFIYAYGALVIWVPKGSPLAIEKDGLEALADPTVKRIAIPNPRVAPYGRAAAGAMESAGVYERVKDRLVLGQNVSQTAQFAQSGNAQVALVPLSLALAPPLSEEGRHVRVPDGTYERIAQAGVVLKGARQPGLARDLAAFVVGPGRATLERYGYVVPGR